MLLLININANTLVANATVPFLQKVTRSNCEKSYDSTSYDFRVSVLPYNCVPSIFPIELTSPRFVLNRAALLPLKKVLQHLFRKNKEYIPL